MRSLIATIPVTSSRESLVTLFDENRKKVGFHNLLVIIDRLVKYILVSDVRVIEISSSVVSSSQLLDSTRDMYSY